MSCARKGRSSSVFFPPFSHFYKYDRSYKMLSHLKVHSILLLLFFFNNRKCHHNKILKHITSILGRGLAPYSYGELLSVNIIWRKKDEGWGGFKGWHKHRKRERNKDHEDEGNVKHLWRGGNREGGGMGTRTSRFIPRSSSISAENTTSSALPAKCLKSLS